MNWLYHFETNKSDFLSLTSPELCYFQSRNRFSFMSLLAPSACLFSPLVLRVKKKLEWYDPKLLQTMLEKSALRVRNQVQEVLFFFFFIWATQSFFLTSREWQRFCSTGFYFCMRVTITWCRTETLQKTFDGRVCMVFKIKSKKMP